MNQPWWLAAGPYVLALAVITGAVVVALAAIRARYSTSPQRPAAAPRVVVQAAEEPAAVAVKAPAAAPTRIDRAARG